VTDPACTEVPDPAILRAERRLRLLEELAEIGMDLARTLRREAVAAAEPEEAAAPEKSARGDPADAFARLSRAVRLTLALEARIDDQLSALRAGVAAEVEARRFTARKRAADEAAAKRRDRRETVERLVFEAAEREVEDEEAMNGVLEALEERLEDDDAYWNLERAPLREVVEHLCADLELAPDWSLWEGEGWTPEPPLSRSRFSIWARPSRTPLRPFEQTSPHRRE
jgi:hypothetical protein